VYRVCRRVLRHDQDAEDAFQATFLVLARKAGSIRARAASTASLSGWLHRVAFRISLKARQRQVQQQVLESELQDIPEPEQNPAWVWRDLRPVLDEEVNALPEKLRVPFILCHLEGNTNEEAARLLGCPVGTVLSRLSRARNRLRDRLTRRGLSLSATLLAALLGEHAAALSFPAVLTAPTAGAAAVFLGGRSTSVTTTSTTAAAWAEEFLRGLRQAQVKRGVAGLVGAVVLALLLGMLFFRMQSPGQGARVSDEQRLRGAWTVLRLEVQGQEQPGGDARMVFGEGQCQLLAPDGNALPMTFRLDPTREPRAIDLEYFLQNERVVARGIYQLAGDRLRICYGFSFVRGEPPAERPSRFVTHPGRKELLYYLEREKADHRPDANEPAK
jgi:RNA polymerase sigma factor (sigma-70 family)